MSFRCRTDCSACVDYQPWNTEVLVESSLLQISAMLYQILALFGKWIDFNFRSKIRECYAVVNAFTIRNMFSLLLYMKCNSRKINRPTKNMTKIVSLLHFKVVLDKDAS
jgi:hypothetical protein